MSGRIPEDGFAFYYSLGPERSLRAVAEEYGVSKQAVAKVAKRENWQERVRAIDAEAKEKVDRQLAETVEEMNLKHLKFLKVVQAKALEALKAMPLSSAMEGIRGLEMAIRQERLIRGEPTDRDELSIAEVVERESRRWLREMEDGSEGARD